MKKWLKKKLRGRRKGGIPEPLVTVSVSASALLHNLAEFSRLAPEGRIAPVLKSNAYGHGLVAVAQVLENAEPAAGIPFFVIDSYFEARVLRDAGIRSPLLVIGYAPTETIVRNRLTDVRFTVGSLETLRKLDAAPNTFGKKIKSPFIHLKIDTGMRRQGILPGEIDEALDIIAKNNENGSREKTGRTKIILEGIATHFADADNDDATFTDMQVAAWNAAVEKIRGRFPSLAYWHASNTAGHGHARGRHSIEANVSRLGIGLYGIADGQGKRLEKNLHGSLRPALAMTTVISGIKKLRAGESVGYSRTFVAPHDMTIATIPVGYFEGVDRRLSNKGFVKIMAISPNSSPAAIFTPIIGRVSMNITVIDVTEAVKRLPDLREGYPVTVISATPGDENSVSNIASVCGTIPYEILAHIPAHLKRSVE